MKQLYILLIKLIVALTQRFDILLAWARSKVQPEYNDSPIITVPEKSIAVAIVAVWQSVIDDNFFQALKILAENKFDLIVINNKSLSADDRCKIESIAFAYHERKPGLGRDFAAYRCAILGTYKSLVERTSVNDLIFINDSVLINPNIFKSFIKKFIVTDGDVVALTETTPVHYHVSSWFFMVRRTVFTNKAFFDYWLEYKPYQSRPYAISKGEVGLTRCYKSLGANINVVYNSDRIVEVLMKQDVNKLFVQRFLPKNVQESIISLRQDAPNYDFFWYDLDRYSNQMNQTHFWQLILLNFFAFPFVKKDIYTRQIFTLNQLRSGLAVFEDAPSCNIYFNKLTSVITNDEQSFLKRFFIKASVQ